MLDMSQEHIDTPYREHPLINCLLCASLGAVLWVGFLIGSRITQF